MRERERERVQSGGDLPGQTQHLPYHGDVLRLPRAGTSFAAWGRTENKS